MREGKSLRFALLSYLVASGVISLAAWQVVVGGAAWHHLDSLREVLKRGYQFFKLDWSTLPALVQPALETAAVALAGAILGGILAAGIESLGRRGYSARRLDVLMAIRSVLVGSGRVHELVWALFLISVFGPNVFAASVALSLTSAGRIGAHFAPWSVDSDLARKQRPGGSGAVRSPGATLRTYLSAGADNLGRAAVLGLVGGGGLGQAFYTSLVIGSYGAAAVTFLVTLAMLGAGQLLKTRVIRNPLRTSNEADTHTFGSSEKQPSHGPRRASKLRAAYGFSGIASLAMLPFLVSVIGLYEKPDMVSSSLQFNHAALLPGLAWALSETVQTILVAVAFGGAAAILLEAACRRDDGSFRSFFRGSSRYVVVIAMAIPAPFLVLLCRSVLGIGPLAAVIALSVGAFGLVGRALFRSRDGVPGNFDGHESFTAGLYLTIATDTFMRLLPLAAIIGFFGAGGTGWLLKLAMQHGDAGHSLTVMLVIVVLMLLPANGRTWLRHQCQNPGALRANG